MITLGLVVYNEENWHEILEEKTRRAEASDSISKVLIVDNYNKNRCRKIVKKYPKVELLESTRNSIGLARQLIINSSLTPWVLFSDADCIWPEKYLRELSSILENVENSVACVGGAYLADGPLSSYLAFMGKYKILHLGSTQFSYCLEQENVEHIPAGAMAVRKSALEGLSVSDYDWAGEDLMISFWLSEKKYEIYRYPVLNVLHLSKMSWLKWLEASSKYGYGRSMATLRSNRGSFTLLLIMLFPYVVLGILIMKPLLFIVGYLLVSLLLLGLSGPLAMSIFLLVTYVSYSFGVHRYYFLRLFLK